MAMNSYKSEKICIVMVGLPGRGKSFISKQILRYLKWLNVNCHIFNAGEYRRNLSVDSADHSFFDPANQETSEFRENIASSLIEEIIEWFSYNKGIVVFDATNVKKERRSKIYNSLTSYGILCLYIESVCTDETILTRNIENVKIKSKDYIGKEAEKSKEDFRARISQYEKIYVPLNRDNDENHFSYIKVFDAGKHFEIRNYKENFSKLIHFVMSQKTDEKVYFFTRHGESLHNIIGKIGGDSDLSDDGIKYSKKLQLFFEKYSDMEFKLFTSTLKRTIQTAHSLPFEKYHTPLLNEINAGTCDDMTYYEIKRNHPQIYKERKNDKFNFRYPNGESYTDIYSRVESILMEFEKHKNIIVVSHNAVIRCLLAYFLNISLERTAYIHIPLNHIFKLSRKSYDFELEIFEIDIETNELTVFSKGNQLMYIDE